MTKRLGEGHWVRLDIQVACAVIEPDLSPGPFKLMHGTVIEGTQVLGLGSVNTAEELTEPFVVELLNRLNLRIMGSAVQEAVRLKFQPMGSIPDGSYLLDDERGGRFLRQESEGHELMVDADSVQYVGKTKPREKMD